MIKQLTLALLLLISFGLRVWFLGSQELRGDEAFGYFFSLTNFGEIIKQTLALQEPHPVASYFVQKIWLEWAGHSEFALRFVSAWFGVAAVALVYRLGNSLRLGAGRSLAAAALMALSPYGVWHSQDARMYSMSLALTICSTWLAFEWITASWSKERLTHELWRSRDENLGGSAAPVHSEKQRSRAKLSFVGVGYLVTSWLALQTHYFALFVIVAQNIYAVVSAAQISPMPADVGRGATGNQPHYVRQILPWLALQVALGLLYLPWFVRVRSILGGYGGNGDSPAFGAMLWRSMATLSVGESLTIPESWLFVAAAGLLVLWGCVRLWQTDKMGKQAATLLLLYLGIPLLATWVASLQRPIFNERYLIASAPPFYLLMAASLPKAVLPVKKLFSKKSSLVALWLLLAVGGGMGISLYSYYTNPKVSKTIGWRELSATLSRMTAGLPVADVRMVENFPDPTLWYYYDGPVEHLVLPPAPHDLAGAHREVAALGETERVLLVVQPANNWDDSAIAQAALSTRYRLVAETHVAAWPVQIYTLPPPQLPTVNQAFQNGVWLVGAAQAPDLVVPGGLLAVHLAWNLEKAILSSSPKVFIHLVGPNGQLVAQNDRPLLVNGATEFVASYGILIPIDAPSGNYRLLAGLYEPELSGAPRILTSSGADSVEIGVLSSDQSRH